MTVATDHKKGVSHQYGFFCKSIISNNTGVSKYPYLPAMEMFRLAFLSPDLAFCHQNWPLPHCFFGKGSCI